MQTKTLKRGQSVTVSGVTYWNDTLPCQTAPNWPTQVTPKLWLVPPGAWKISAKLTVIALP